MFERNRVEHNDQNGVPVEITTAEGEIVSGRMMVPLGRSFTETLNGTTAFIVFEAWGGDRMFMAKSALKAVKMVNVPKAENLKSRASVLEGFDPHTVLGVPTSASLEDVKAAWIKLNKIYHPDRYATADLPAEVKNYISAMSKRVNAAYSAIEAPIMLARKAAATRQVPIYESHRRA
ncbi:MAG: DnaJ family molecular chaperone [Hyphomicrobiaceae bacterium]